MIEYDEIDRALKLKEKITKLNLGESQMKKYTKDSKINNTFLNMFFHTFMFLTEVNNILCKIRNDIYKWFLYTYNETNKNTINLQA